MPPDDFSANLARRFEEFESELGPRLDRSEQELKATPVHVIVFGVGKAGKLYGKRQQIRDELNKLPGVTAYFPEQKEFAEPFIKRYRIPAEATLALEIVQAESADVIVALEPGSGVEQEVAIFSTRPRFAVKLFNLLPKKHEKTPTSFPGHIRAGVTKYFYTPAELKNCTVATKVVVEHVSLKQIQKMFL